MTKIALFAILNAARGAGAWDALYANRIIACLAMGLVGAGMTWNALGLAALLWLGFSWGWSHAYMFGRPDDWSHKAKILAWGDKGDSFYQPYWRRFWGASAMSVRWLLFAPAVAVYGDWRYIPVLLLAGYVYLVCGIVHKFVNKRFSLSFAETNTEYTAVRVAEMLNGALLGWML